MTNIGILGLGMYLPPEIRTNAWWPEHVVAGWMEQRRTAPPPPPAASAPSPGVARVLAAMASQAVDPYQGAVARHVVPDGMTHLDMETLASRDAIERAGIDPSQIDLVLVTTLCPDYLGSNLACALHHRLELPTAGFAMQTDAAQYSILMQLTLAEAMIKAGRARTALLVQSSISSRLIDPADPISPLFGDGATAVVVGPVGSDRGLLSSVHRVEGTSPRMLIASVPGGTLLDEGRVRLHIGDPVAMRDVLLRTADVCKESIDAALAAAGLTTEDVDFLCLHQGTPWLRQIVHEHAGLTRARSFDTFERTAHLHAALIPSKLVAAEREQRLAAGDLVVLVGGGTGQAYGATVMRWGT